MGSFVEQLRRKQRKIGPSETISNEMRYTGALLGHVMSQKGCEVLDKKVTGEGKAPLRNVE